MDWRAFCEEHRIDSSEGGASSKKDNIYVECPWCRNGKKRLGMSTEPPYYWGCWLEDGHRGKSPLRLIMALAGVSYEEACDIAGIVPTVSDLDELLREMAELQKTISGVSGSPRLRRNGSVETSRCGVPASSRSNRFDVPRQWFGIRPKGRLSRPFVHYLIKRGLSTECCDRYQLMATQDVVWSDGKRLDYRGRVISPIIVEGQVVAVTARSIHKKEPYRYLTHPSEVPNQVLYNSQHAVGGQVLVLVEGPYDAKKLDWVAHASNLPVHSVASMGLVLSREKVGFLQKLMKRYSRTVILFDKAQLPRAVSLQERLYAEISVGTLPEGVKDPAELSLSAASAFLMNFLH